MTDNTNTNMTEKDLTKLANRIVSKMMHLKTMEQWFEHVRDTNMAEDQDFYALNISEEYEAMGDLAKLITLLNLYTGDEEYEKCIILKRRIDTVNKILDKYGDYFNKVKAKAKVIKLVDRVDIHTKDENDNSFFSKELDKLRNSLSKEEMRQFYEVAYATHLKEKQQKEETRQLIKLKHEKKNETQ